ncbi:MAG: hypothetical protein KKF46_05405 [Nanoarchaeota archaeon]|nr:hypothetical protein [Nanoarchaeota archaeon]MBU1321769.1 hypothetical protein [Nanoarchaeota archaeon]MBU1598468.1 hypothetical protein [Nanoarchaeota archaeon]MBU2442304.1 hypothetical protein [Nanoarchaeota archaeon]
MKKRNKTNCDGLKLSRWYKLFKSADTLNEFICQYKRKGIKEVDVEVHFYPWYMSYVISLDPTLKSYICSDGYEEYKSDESVMGHLEAKYASLETKKNVLIDAGTKRALEIAEKMQEHGLEVTVRGRKFEDYKTNEIK